MLEWICRRLDGEVEAVDTPIGRVARAEDLNTDGLDLPAGAMDTLLTVDTDAVRAELPQVSEHLEKFGDTLPSEVRTQFEQLQQKLG